MSTQDAWLGSFVLACPFRVYIFSLVAEALLRSEALGLPNSCCPGMSRGPQDYLPCSFCHINVVAMAPLSFHHPRLHQQGQEGAAGDINPECVEMPQRLI